MVHVKCPDCSREIVLSDDDLLLVIECAACEARFGPIMIPVDGALAPPPRAPLPVPAAPAEPKRGYVAEPQRSDEPDEPPPNHARPRKRPRKRKRAPQKRSILPVVLLILATLGGTLTIAGAGYWVIRDALNERQDQAKAAAKPTGQVQGASRPGPAGVSGNVASVSGKLGSAVVGTGSSPAKRRDPDSIEGEWLLKAWRVPRISVHQPTSRAGPGLSIAGGKAEWLAAGDFLRAGKGTISVDRAVRPHRVTLKTASETYQGVFALSVVDEDDILTVSFGAADGGYPAKVWDFGEFSSHPERNEKIEGEKYSVVYVRPDAPGSTDDRLEGTWRVASLIVNGKEEIEIGNSTKMTFKGDKLTIKNERFDRTSSFRLDTSRSPASIDVVEDYGNGQVEKMKGIYAVEERQITICQAMSRSVQRPEEFVSSPGQFRLLITLVPDDGNFHPRPVPPKKYDVNGDEVMEGYPSRPRRSGPAGARQLQINLQEIAFGLRNYNDAHGALPPVAICDANGKPLLSWRVAILGLVYTGEENSRINLWKEFNFSEPWDSPHNKKLLRRMPPLYGAPGDPEAAQGMTRFRGFFGRASAFFGPGPQTTPEPLGRKLEAGFPDGPGSTILVVEAGEAVPWTKPDDFPYDPAQPLPKLGWFSKDGFHAAFGDCTVKFLPTRVNERSLRAAITPAGGETIDPKDLASWQP
jgi:uncharacterized protein (TIGR03067 family)